MNIGIRRLMSVLICVSLMLMTGCTTGQNGQQGGDPARTDTGFIVYGPDSYDSADTPVLVAKDEEAGTMTFLNLTLGKKYTLEYDGTTCFYDKYGSILTLSQIEIGEIVNVKFVKPKKHLTSMSISPDGWTINNTTRYVIDTARKDVTIGEDVYNISSDASYFSNDTEIELWDLISTDTLTFRGIGTSVYSVVVENGHGYLRITGQENFVGGWIEVGNKIIQRVYDDMILTVPEGSYQVKISYGGTVSEKRVTIFRNSESKLDFSDVVFEDPKMGMVLFSVNPTTAELYIDGEKADYSAAIELSYGLHQLICRADGYKTVTQYLSVGQASAGIDIVLEKNEEGNDSTSNDSNSSDSNNNSGNNSSGNSSNNNNNNGSSNNTDANNNGNTGNTGNNGNTGNTGSTGNNGSTDNNSNTGDSNNTDNNNNGNGSNGNSDGNTSDGTNTVTTYYQVHIDAPENVEVYIDGSYVGVSPCSFKKNEGSHIVTLSKNGYTTRSYTIYVDSEDRDVSFSFVELTPAN